MLVGRDVPQRGHVTALDDVEMVFDARDTTDLAPMIHRQRLVIEGIPAAPIDDAQIREYLSRLTLVCGMHPLMEPVTHRSDRYGWAGWIHWETSGAHFYAWETPMMFFSVDMYTCKPFDVFDAVAFTREFFECDDIVAKGF